LGSYPYRSAITQGEYSIKEIRGSIKTETQYVSHTGSAQTLYRRLCGKKNTENPTAIVWIMAVEKVGAL
jgi:hypothetical protein